MVIGHSEELDKSAVSNKSDIFALRWIAIPMSAETAWPVDRIKPFHSVFVPLSLNPDADTAVIGMAICSQ